MSTRLLDQIELPRGIKSLNREELSALAEEIRELIIATTSKNGGHIGPSLGVVELTLALHRVFDSPKDRFVFDVGAQAYPHKILTGRKDQFCTLRQYEGVSGFCRREESPHDILGAGHAGTALSAALGIAEGMRIRQEKEGKVIALVGDGSMTCGMVFEAMNQMSPAKRRVIFIVNDNSMSIAPNVGAVAEFLSRNMTSPFVNKLWEDVRWVISKIPNFGDDILGLLHRVKHSVKSLVLPTVLFEGFGYRYVGPLDGHDIEGLEATLENVRKLDEPVLLHVLTQKGRGYTPALEDQELFHGLGPFDRVSGKLIKKAGPPTYTQVFADTVTRLAETDPRIVAITAAMPLGTGLRTFEKKFPDRFFDVGIAEEHAVTFAAGLAIENTKPVCAIYSTFMQRGFDQLVHDVCLQNLNVMFALDRAGIVGDDGPTHHGVFDLSYLRMVPNLVIMAPKDEAEFQRMIKTGIDHQGSIAVRYPRGTGLGVPLYEREIPTVPVGQAEIVYYPHDRFTSDEEGPLAYGGSLEGEAAYRFISRSAPWDVVIWAIGSSVASAVDAVRNLAERAPRTRVLVVNARFAKPIDTRLLSALSTRTSGIVTVEENVLAGGFGSAIQESLEALDLSLPVRRIGIGDFFVEHGTQAILRRDCQIDAAGIESQITEFLKSLDRSEPALVTLSGSTTLA